MKHLALTIVITLFSFNTFAAGRCVIAFASIGRDDIDQKAISKKNYQMIDSFDIKAGDLHSTITGLEYEEVGNYKVITFNQIISMTYQNGRELYLNPIHKQFVEAKLTLAQFKSLEENGLDQFIGKLRTQYMPQCEK